jgi:hypothetical protein
MNGKYGMSSSGPSKSIFWFSIPLKPISLYTSVSDFDTSDSKTMVVTVSTPSLLRTVHSANACIKNATSNKLKDPIESDPFP